jgi:hypothetical protein
MGDLVLSEDFGPARVVGTHLVDRPDPQRFGVEARLHVLERQIEVEDLRLALRRARVARRRREGHEDGCTAQGCLTQEVRARSAVRTIERLEKGAVLVDVFDGRFRGHDASSLLLSRRHGYGNHPSPRRVRMTWASDLATSAGRGAGRRPMMSLIHAA